MNKTTYILLGILLLSFVIRIWNLAGPDMLVDDALYSFRSIGYIDYVASINKQSTPVTWFDEPHWWQGLSFHDNPPFVFAVQRIFFGIGGDNLWASRIPFVLAGLLSILFIFLLGKYVADEKTGLIAAGMLAVMNYAVWISRIGLLDGFVMLFVILSLFFFLKAKEKDTYYIWWAVMAGFGILSKYTFIFMFPVFLIGLLIRQRDAFKKKNFYIALVILFLLILPLITYNAMMWKERGHPDAALSSLFGIQTDDFSGLVHRSVSKNLNIADIAFHMVKDHANSGMGLLIGLGILLFFYLLWKEKEKRNIYILIGSGLLLGLFMLGLIGASERYNIAVLPLFVLAGAVGISWAWRYFKKPLAFGLALTALTCILLIELFFTFQNQLIAAPIIKHPALVSDIYTHPRWLGYNALDSYVEQFYKDNPDASPVIPFAEAPQLAQYQLDLFNKRYPDKNIPAQKHLLVYDDRMDWTAAFWIFERRKLYDIAPIHSISQFLMLIRQYGIAYYTDFEFTDATFIATTDASRQNTGGVDEELAAFVDDMASNVQPINELYAPDGTKMFRVFRLPLK